MTGIWRVSEESELVATKLTVMVQVAPGIRVAQFVVEAKLGVAVVGVAI